VLLVPGGNFNLELYFSASSSGGNPSFYVELYKYDGSTFTLLATDVASPEGITQGTVIDTYFTALSVPPTVMALTDRLALRVFVTTSGRTIVLHTENSNLCQVITTLSTGINAINGITAQVQNLATGTAGTDFAISSAGSTHTFNLPTASAANRGALSSADWSTFNSKQNNIGLTTVGNNLATLANPSAISYIRINADNTTTTRTPAQVLTDLGISNPLSSVTLTSDVTISAVNTSLADVTGLSFPITAGTSYRFRAELQVITSASGTGMKFAVNANAGVASIAYRAISVGSTAGVQVFWSSFTLDSSTGVTTATVTNQYVTIEGLVTGNNNGTVIMRFGKMIAVAGSLTVKAGSILTYQTV